MLPLIRMKSGANFGERIMKNFLFKMVLICMIAAPCLFAQPFNSSQGRVTQISVPMMTITNQSLIKLLMDEFFIPETLVTRMEIIDVGRNGFGPKDLVHVYPSDEIYFVEYVSKKAQDLMNNWEFKANFQIVAQNSDPNMLGDYTERKPAYNIFISLLRSLDKNYKDLPIKLKLERDSTTVMFEMWDYNESALNFLLNTDSSSPGRRGWDWFSTGDSTHYDCIFVYKTIVDTVYIYRPGPKSDNR